MFQAGNDGCLSVFGLAYATGALVFPPNARVLEIGCAEADWMSPMLAIRPDLQIVGIDWRACERPAPVIRGNVLTHDWPEASFDAVVGVSSIEHIGLGHYECDPIDSHGDTHCMQRVARWLEPGGWVYADVPYQDHYRVCGTSHREYDEGAAMDRLIVPGLSLAQRWYSDEWSEHLRRLPQPPGPKMQYMVLVATKETA